MKNNLKTLKETLWCYEATKKKLEAFGVEIQEKLKAMPLGRLAYERGYRDALKEVLGIESEKQ